MDIVAVHNLSGHVSRLVILSVVANGDCVGGLGGERIAMVPRLLHEGIE